MNSNLLKKLLAAAITSSFLVSVGVSAAERAPVCHPKCTKGEKCTTTTTNPTPHCEKK
jgi:hypothetical protein